MFGVIATDYSYSMNTCGQRRQPKYDANNEKYVHS